MSKTISSLVSLICEVKFRPVVRALELSLPFHRKDHVISLRQAEFRTGLYIALWPWTFVRLLGYCREINEMTIVASWGVKVMSMWKALINDD